MGEAARTLVTAGTALQIAGILTTAIALRRAQRHFAKRADALHLRRAEDADRAGMANLVLAVIGVAASGMGVARRTWRRVAGASVLAAWWLFRRARKERQHVVAGAGRGSLSLNATATATVTRVPAPRSSVDDLATYVDDVVARLEEERRLIDSRIVIERDERTTAVAEVSRDLDEIAVSGIHLGAWGVALLVAGTALTLIAAWV